MFLIKKNNIYKYLKQVNNDTKCHRPRMDSFVRKAELKHLSDNPHLVQDEYDNINHHGV